jgi:hypothetical protein
MAGMMHPVSEVEPPSSPMMRPVPQKSAERPAAVQNFFPTH